MGTKMKKGILKPIRYISQIFDNKEPEMQIGFPTEVKHVAHIGWDGPNANAPTWMKEYHSAPLNTSCGSEGESPTPNLWGSQGSDFSCGGLEDCPPVDDSAPPPTRPRHTRRHKSDETSSRDVVIDSAHGGDSSGADGSKKSRKGRKSKDSGGGSQDMPAIPKQSHRRRSKDSSGGASVRTSKSKASASKSSDAAAAAAEEGSSKPATSLDYGFGAEEQ
ncbi:hypothetical protein Cni_G18387 [Canna indica]|uniref:CRIB domain-containing protein n=1 Tax=Canna indica TaxID=4628 RepID=A0AAQ3KJ86_9LILI|nr:hypothetical protein Cni_G18387 [Canna indica]